MDDDLERDLRATLRAHAGPLDAAFTAADIRARAGHRPARADGRRPDRRRALIPALAAAAVVAVVSLTLIVGGPRSVPVSPGGPSTGSNTGVPSSESTPPPGTATVTATSTVSTSQSPSRAPSQSRSPSQAPATTTTASG